MATIGDAAIRAVMTMTGGPPFRITLDEAATQTYVAGELVYSSAGYVTEIAGDTPGQILGVAGADGDNDAAAGSSAIPVFLADPSVLFEANMKDDSDGDHVSVVTDIGTVMGIQRVTADSKVYLDADVVDGASARVFVHKLATGSAMGDTNARVLFSFLPNWVQFLGTS